MGICTVCHNSDVAPVEPAEPEPLIEAYFPMRKPPEICSLRRLKFLFRFLLFSLAFSSLSANAYLLGVSAMLRRQEAEAADKGMNTRRLSRQTGHDALHAFPTAIPCRET